jgi:hypothetical protein
MGPIRLHAADGIFRMDKDGNELSCWYPAVRHALVCYLTARDFTGLAEQ